MLSVNKIRCRWCPYEVSLNVRIRMVRHEKTVHWYKFHVETAAPLKDRSFKQDHHNATKKGVSSVRKSHHADTSVPWKGKNETGSKVKSVVKTVNKIEKENISPRVEKVVEMLSPLRETSPFDLEFEDMFNTPMISVEEGELFNGKVKEDVTDANKLDDSVGVVTGVAMNESNEGIQGKEKNYEIEEMSLEEGNNIVESLVTSELFEKGDVEHDLDECENTENSDEMQENRVVVVAEIHEENEQEVPTDDDIRHVIVDGDHPTPSYLPPRITITEKPYGKLYGFRHFELPTIKMDEDPRNVLLAPPSNYSDTEEGRILKRLREKARRQGCEVTNVPDGYSGIIKTERCELPDGTIYSLTSHWVPQLPIRKQQHFSAQWGTRSELDFSAQCNITMETEEVGSQTEDVRIVTRTTGSECDIISCRMY